MPKFARLTRRACCASLALTVTLVLATCSNSASAFLIQPYNYALDDSAILGTMTPGRPSTGDDSFNDDDAAADNRLKLNRAIDVAKYASEADDGEATGLSLSPEMTEYINEKRAREDQQQASSSSATADSVADIILNVAQAAAESVHQQQRDADSQANAAAAASNAAPIFELDTSRGQHIQAKADMKESNQWYNPKEIIPALKISAKATPSKYKKVYFRAEKKLVDGAFHQDGSEFGATRKEFFLKPFKGGSVQRRSSRGSHSTAASPPGLLDNGVIDFMKKFREVYIQTRPAQASSSSSSSSSSGGSFASNVLAAAASLPSLSAALAPSKQSGQGSSSSSSALSSVASAVVASATGASGNSASPAAATGASSSSSGAGASATSGSQSASRPFSTQAYVSFWSKTFPTWVRKMLKQFRRRSLQNSNRRQQQKQQQHHAHSHNAAASSNLMQAASAIAESAVDHATNPSSSSSAVASGSPSMSLTS